MQRLNAHPAPAWAALVRFGLHWQQAGLASTRQQPARNPFWLIAASSLWLATVSNLALWREMRLLSLLNSPSGWLFGVAMVGIIALAFSLLLSALAWRWTLKPTVLALLVIAAFGQHFMLGYGVVIDPGMVMNALLTDGQEVRALLNTRLLLSVVVLAVLPAVVVWRTPLTYGRWPRRIAHNLLWLLLTTLLLAGTVLASFQTLSSTMRNHKQLRYLINPLNAVYAVGHVATQSLRRHPSVILPIGQDAKLGASYQAQSRLPLLLLVLGETGRSGNFALNGYPRPTTPELAAQDVASFRNVWSCGTSTAASVPCMFSHLGKSGYAARDNNFEGLLDVIQRAGLAVLWIDNQEGGCKGVCDRVPHVSTADLKHPTLCNSSGCFDGIMLEQLDARIAALPTERRARGVVLVMHQLGSHGPAYHERSPTAFKRFLPECTSNALQDCTRQEVVNAYDNSIAYTDHFLASAIGWLKQHQTDADAALLYLADHGESLGENNLYLHGMPYALAPDVQKKVPWVTWLSSGFERRSRIQTACLKAVDEPLSHDHLFHSVLGLLDVQTTLYQRTLDAYVGCKQAADHRLTQSTSGPVAAN